MQIFIFPKILKFDYIYTLKKEEWSILRLKKNQMIYILERKK
jgi:hypothetical protein